MQDLSVEVLMAVMNSNCKDSISYSNLQSDAIIINQCEINKYEEEKIEDSIVRFFSVNDRGLSRSRNLALDLAKGDICLICDDDVKYIDGYVEIVKKAFSEIKDADIIIFDSLMKKRNGEFQSCGFQMVKRIPRYKTYASCLIAFKREKIQKNQIHFNTNFGTGSGKYSMGEEAIFLRECYKCGLKAYIFPSVIHEWDFSETTWFEGYNRKYFNDIGAYLAESFPYAKHFVKYYYPLRLHKECNLRAFDVIKYINEGIRNYRINTK